MARVYAQIGTRLDSDVKARTRDLKFSTSFIGLATDVSKAVASMSPATDLSTMEKLAVYGATEKARFEEVDKQLTLLKADSPKDAITALKQARVDIGSLAVKIETLRGVLGTERVSVRNGAATEAKEKSEFARTTGSDQFKRSFFTAVGSPEWENFAKSVHALARKEGEKYPSTEDHCLLCERPFDEPSRAHVTALLSFVEGDAQRAAQGALAALQKEIEALEVVETNVFAEGSRVREHVHRIDPAAETAVADFAMGAATHKDNAMKALRGRGLISGSVETTSIATVLTGLLKRIDEDIVRLEKDDPTKAIAALELERQTLRHREVLSQLMLKIRTDVTDAKWCARAASAKSALSPRHITEKEKELFAEIIGESYRERLADECHRLGCLMPIELQTAGQKGETVRSLAIKGGYPPDAILSEGEQKAVALADFLTEVMLNPGSAGIILDDPVTSQDHERKELIAKRLVDEARKRQVIVFTHDLPFLNQIILHAESGGIAIEAHWIERGTNGAPGQITLNDVPATSKAYDTVERAKQCLAEANAASGTARRDAIMKGMGALRRTIEETVVKKLFKLVVPRWQDRVIVTSLRKVAWDNALVDEMVDMYEELSAYIEGHSHTDEAIGAPPETKELEQAIARLDAVIKRARAERTIVAKSIPLLLPTQADEGASSHSRLV